MKLFLYLLIFVGLTELILRMFRPGALDYYRSVKELHEYNKDVGVVLQTNRNIFIRHHSGLWEGQFTTDEIGLRKTTNFSPQDPKLLCLGDSLVMGFGVSDNETFCSQLTDIIWKSTLLKPLNLGVDAYGSMGYYRRLKQMLPNLPNTKLVLLFISPNDFSMPKVMADRGVLPDDIVDARQSQDPKWKERFELQFHLTEYSFLMHALKLAYEETRLQFFTLLETVSTKPELHFSFPRYAAQNPISNAPKVCPEAPVGFSCMAKPRSFPPLPEETKIAYNQILDLKNLYQFDLVVVFVPGQIEEIYCHLNGAYHNLGDYANQSLDFWKSKGIETIELISETHRMCDSEKGIGIKDHFIPLDGHLTKLGNEWVSQGLKKYLKDRN